MPAGHVLVSVSEIDKSMVHGQVDDDFYVFSSATDHNDESYTNSSLIALRLDSAQYPEVH